MSSTVETMSFQLVADYQLLGDDEVDGIPFLTLILQEAKDANDILDFKILHCLRGSWGIQFLTFTVDVDLPFGTFDEVREEGRMHLNKIIRDTDVKVRWVGKKP